MAHKPDEVTATNSGGGSFAPHPAGQFAAVCVDVINYGEKVESYEGGPDKLVKKVGLVFRTGELNDKGEVVDIAREFTVSMHENASLRGFLEAWRGKSFTAEEVDKGAPLHKLCGVPCLLSVEHKPSGDRVYGNLKGIAPLPKQMAHAAPKADGYERPKYLEDRKAKYAEAAAKYRASINAPKGGGGFENFPDAQDDSDDLPF